MQVIIEDTEIRSRFGALRWRMGMAARLVKAGLAALFVRRIIIRCADHEVVSVRRDVQVPYKLPDPDHDPHKTPVMNPPPVGGR